MMDFSVYVSLLIFSLVMSITPGPNNLLLATSGLAYGFRRTLPALFGTLAGLAVLFVISGAGVGAIVLANQTAQVALRDFGAGYLAYRSDERRVGEGCGRTVGYGWWPD